MHLVQRGRFRELILYAVHCFKDEQDVLTPIGPSSVVQNR